MPPVARSFTKMSIEPFVSPDTRFDARLSKATQRSSAENAGDSPSQVQPLHWFDSPPAASTLARTVDCAGAAAEAASRERSVAAEVANRRCVVMVGPVPGVAGRSGSDVVTVRAIFGAGRLARIGSRGSATVAR